MGKRPDIIGMLLERVEQEIDDDWQPPRVPQSYRGSELGDCPRALQYAALGKSKEKPNPELALLFRDGHLHHDAVRGELKKIGRLTNIEHGAWKAYQVEYKGDTFRINITATCDLHYDGLYVGDIKSINCFTFKALKSVEDVEERYPHYIDQLQAYLDVYDKEEGFLLFKDKNSSALKIFWFKRDPKRLETILQKLAHIEYLLKVKKMHKKPYTKSSYDCKICPMRIHCWKVPQDRRTWR